MPSPKSKSKSKPTLSMSRPSLDPDAAEAFVRGAAPTPAVVAPKLVEVVASEPSVSELPQAVVPTQPKARSKPGNSKSLGGGVAPQRGIVTRSSGRQVRRRVVYLPPKIDKDLAVAAAVRGVDVSEVVADLLRRHL